MSFRHGMAWRTTSASFGPTFRKGLNMIGHIRPDPPKTPLWGHLSHFPTQTRSGIDSTSGPRQLAPENHYSFGLVFLHARRHGANCWRLHGPTLSACCALRQLRQTDGVPIVTFEHHRACYQDLEPGNENCEDRALINAIATDQGGTDSCRPPESGIHSRAHDLYQTYVHARNDVSLQALATIAEIRASLEALVLVAIVQKHVDMTRG
ncbi:hypothetical protein DFP72DRAFT_843243 [Ephemerocybe angulata]|uniref:Uncharacterized protein n=1 Tax=Ephemerocybe angulata TaxID=980116 RepID=A0A8H6I8P7_9AGAR|nr:hypothetical protein DFP72DRAFT_843243 [Tulosesus angulatus]